MLCKQGLPHLPSISSMCVFGQQPGALLSTAGWENCTEMLGMVATGTEKSHFTKYSRFKLKS